MESKFPVFTDIQAAHKRIAPLIHRTPVFTSKSINALCGAELYFKCENFQKVGAFKFRGACNAVISLLESQHVGAVATHSSGNHAAALAQAARIQGLKAYVVMPRTAPQIKRKAVAGYGGVITLCEPTLQSREETLQTVIKETAASVIHPYNDFSIIAGQATAAKELIEDIADLDIIMAPVGGGGLLSGTAIAAKALQKNVHVVAAEPLNADDAYRSFKSGILQPSVNPSTIADGLLTSLCPLTFAIIQKYVDDIVTVNEESIIEAMRMVWERMKIIIEPSSAVPLGAILDNKIDISGKKTGIILSGGNVDLCNMPF